MNNKEIMLWILNYLKTEGRMPRLDDLATGLGVSKERARQRIVTLENEGYLVRIGRGWRNTHTFTTKAVLELI